MISSSESRLFEEKAKSLPLFSQSVLWPQTFLEHSPGYWGHWISPSSRRETPPVSDERNCLGSYVWSFLEMQVVSWVVHTICRSLTFLSAFSFPECEPWILYVSIAWLLSLSCMFKQQSCLSYSFILKSKDWPTV